MTKLTRIISVLVCAAMLAGCAGAPAAATAEPQAQAPAAQAPEATAAPTESPATETPAEDVTIKVSLWDAETSPTFTSVINAFEAKFPNIKVQPIDTVAADYTNKLSVMLNGGSEVDAFWIKDADTIFGMVNKGQTEDLSSRVAASGVNLADFNGLADSFQIDGKLVAMPFRTDYYVLFYNKAVFDAAGVPYPTNDMTWAQFEETAKLITAGEGADKKYGAHFHTWQACVENWGVQDGKNTILSSDYSFFKPYYEMALRMQDVDKTALDYATLKTSNIHYSSQFYSGNVGMLPMGTWFATTLIDKIKSGESTATDWGIATLPHPEGTEAGYTVGSTTPIAINSASTKKDAAWEFINFVTSEEGAKTIAKDGAFPARLNPDTLSIIVSADGMPEGAADALTVKNIVLDRPIADKVTEINQMLGEEHGLIMLGELSVDEGLAEMAERAAEILK
ncbi:MAG: sugar ABC transporter substrate-binding protein [Clostridiales bacterium]|nr:sugar ABC transporter substrate-binding protein [Clostridiales bacterium]